jgi:hypothetical protein
MATQEEQRLDDGQMTAQSYPGLYYNIGAIPAYLMRHSSILARAFAVRMISVLFGLVAALVTFFAARLACDSPPMWFAAGAAVALQPMEAQMTAAINNDAAVIGFAAIVFYVLMRAVARPARVPSLTEGALLGASQALAILSKPQGLAFVPLTLAVLIWIAMSHGKQSWRFIAIVIGALVIVRAFPEVWTWLFPDPLPEHMNPLRDKLATRAGPFPSLIDFPDWVDTLAADYKLYLFRSTWGQFCWLEFVLGDSWFDGLARISKLVLLGGMAAIALRVIVPPSEKVWWSPLPTALAAASALCAVVFVLFAEYWSRSRLHAGGVIQGRNFLLALPGFMVVVVVALGSLVPARFRTLSAGCIVLGALALNLGSLATIIGYHYADR